MRRTVYAILCLASLVVADGPGPGGVPAGWTALNEAGVEAYRRGDFAEAVSFFRQALSQAGADPAVRGNLARACTSLGRDHLRAGRDAEAERLLKEAVDLDTADPAALCDWSLAMLRLRRERPLREVLEARRASFPGNADVLAALGEVRVRTGDRAGAIEAWEAALTLDEDLAEVRRQLDALKREAAVEAGYQEERAGHFMLTWDADVPHAWRAGLAVHLERAHRTISNDLGHSMRSAVGVVVYPTADFRSVLDAHPWAGGLFDGRRIRIPYVAGSDPAGAEAVVFHEVAHAVLSDVFPTAPAWLQEGFAQHAERSSSSPRPDPLPALRAGAAAGTLLSWEGLQQEFFRIPDAERARIAYAQAFGFYRELDSRFGAGVLRSWIREARGSGLDRASRHFLQEDLPALYEQWLRREGLAGTR